MSPLTSRPRSAATAAAAFATTDSDGAWSVSARSTDGKRRACATSPPIATLTLEHVPPDKVIAAAAPITA